MSEKNMVQKTIDILLFLGEHPEGVKFTEIAQALCFPKTTIFDILKTLVKNDFVMCGVKKEYKISSQIYTLGFVYLHASKLFRITQPYLELLANKYKKTAFIAKRHNDKVIYIYKYVSPYAAAPTSSIGDQKMLHCTATGKCYLTFDKEATGLIGTIKLVPFTPFTITTSKALKEQFDYFKSLGYAYERRESHEMMSCIAVPIYYEGKMVCTISLTGFYMEDESFIGQGKEMVQLGKIISEQLHDN